MESPRTYEEALEFARAQHNDASEDWTNKCLVFVRSSYGIGALFGSAWAQWLGADKEDRHEGGDPADAPLGSALCFKGSSPFGHIMKCSSRLRHIPQKRFKHQQRPDGGAVVARS